MSSIYIDFRYQSITIDLSYFIDYYRVLSEKIVVVLQVNHRHSVVCMVLLSHLIIMACNRFTPTGTFGLFIDLQLFSYIHLLDSNASLQ